MTILTQAELDARLATHEVWRTAGDVPQVHPDPLKQSDADRALVEEWQANGARPFHCAQGDFRGMDFRGKSLRLVGLRGCDLRGADLRGCDLRGADLRKTKLEGANLTGATLDASTRIGGIDVGHGLANRTSLSLLLDAVGGDPEEEQTRALVEAVRRRTGDQNATP